MPADVRRVRPQDWAALRQLRLQALWEAPEAFCERYDDAVRAPDSSWQARAQRGADGGPALVMIGWGEGAEPEPVAMAIGSLDGGEGVLTAVYVAPAHRGTGLLEALVEQVTQWARGQGAARLRLLVHEGNEAARRAYERLGFTPTGHREPYPLDPTADELELALAL